MLKQVLTLQIMSWKSSYKKEKNKKFINLIKDELGGKILTELLGLRAKSYSYLMGDSSEDEKSKGTERCLINRNLKFEDYKNCLEVAQLGQS